MTSKLLLTHTIRSDGEQPKVLRPEVSMDLNPKQLTCLNLSGILFWQLLLKGQLDAMVNSIYCTKVDNSYQIFDYQIKVCSADHKWSANHFTNKYFELRGPPNSTLSSPHTGKVWETTVLIIYRPFNLLIFLSFEQPVTF